MTMLEKTFEKTIFLFVAIVLGAYFFKFNLIFPLVAFTFVMGLLEVATHCLLMAQTTRLDADKILKRIVYKLLLPLLIYVIFWLRLELVQNKIIIYNSVPTAHILATFALMREIVACFTNCAGFHAARKSNHRTND